MGKTENNMVALNQSPEDMFGKVMSWSDDMIVPALELVTSVPIDKIQEIKHDLLAGNNPKAHKAFLAMMIISEYYGEKDAQKAYDHFENTFSEGNVPDAVQ